MYHQIQRLGYFPGFLAKVIFYLVIAVLATSGCTVGHEEREKNNEGAEDHGIVFKRIGVIRSPFTHEKGAPRQGRLASDAESLIVVDSEYEVGLKDIETFSHIVVLYVFDRSYEWTPMVQTPWEKKLHGVFATRSPRRPNPIGMTVVKLVKRLGSTLHVQGLDAFDGSPVLDLKPYIPQFDRIEDANQGWLDDMNRSSE